MTQAPCLAKTDLSAEEYRFLDELPDGANAVEPVATCWLWEGHPGRHMTLGQACGEEDFEWWFYWDDQERGIERVAMCPSQDPAPRDCMLPLGHWGEHDYGGE